MRTLLLVAALSISACGPQFKIQRAGGSILAGMVGFGADVAAHRADGRVAAAGGYLGALSAAVGVVMIALSAPEELDQWTVATFAAGFGAVVTGVDAAAR